MIGGVKEAESLNESYEFTSLIVYGRGGAWQKDSLSPALFRSDKDNRRFFRHQIVRDWNECDARRDWVGATVTVVHQVWVLSALPSVGDPRPWHLRDALGPLAFLRWPGRGYQAQQMSAPYQFFNANLEHRLERPNVVDVIEATRKFKPCRIGSVVSKASETMAG